MFDEWRRTMRKIIYIKFGRERPNGNSANFHMHTESIKIQVMACAPVCRLFQRVSHFTLVHAKRNGKCWRKARSIHMTCTTLVFAFFPPKILPSHRNAGRECPFFTWFCCYCVFVCHSVACRWWVCMSIAYKYMFAISFLLRTTTMTMNAGLSLEYTIRATKNTHQIKYKIEIWFCSSAFNLWDMFYSRSAHTHTHIYTTNGTADMRWWWRYSHEVVNLLFLPQRICWDTRKLLFQSWHSHIHTSRSRSGEFFIPWPHLMALLCPSFPMHHHTHARVSPCFSSHHRHS